MQATITYLLTEEAQRAAMAATGQPIARKQTMTVEVTSSDLEILPISDEGAINLDLTQSYETNNLSALIAAGWERRGANTEARIIDPDVLADLRRGRAVLAERKREQDEIVASNGEHNRRQTEAAYQAFLADSTARMITYEGPKVPNLLSPANYWPREHVAFVEEIKRRNEADVEAKKAVDAAKEQAKTEFIAGWIAEHADAEIKEQFADGLLARSATLDMIANAAFAEAEVPPPAKYDFCSDRDCPCGAKEIESLPRTIYPTWKQIKGSLPDGYTVEFSRVRECLKDDDGYTSGEEEPAGPPIYLAKITIPHGPFTFERTVKLG